MIIRALAILVMLGCGWVAVLAGVMVTTDASPAALVLFPSQDFLNDLPEGAAIMGKTWYSVTLADPQDGFAQSLYQAGALLVLPSGLQGCSLG